MMLYVPIILICSLSNPDSECKVGGKDVIDMTGEPKNTPIGCFIDGEERLSRSAYAPRAEDGYYIHIKCVPKKSEDLNK